MVMREASGDDPDAAAGVYLAGPNQWPGIDGFRATIERYQSAMGALGHSIVELFVDAIGEELPAQAFDPATTWLRLLRYPPRPIPADGEYGSAPHVDFGAVTLVSQDDVGGLAVKAPSGAWVELDPLPGAHSYSTPSSVGLP